MGLSKNNIVEIINTPSDLDMVLTSSHVVDPVSNLEYAREYLSKIRGKVACVYLIKCIITGDLYVGSTNNFSARKSSHIRMIKTNTHHNYKIKKLSKLHDVSSFKIFILEVIDNRDKYFIQKREQYWFDLIKPSLNIEAEISPYGFGHILRHEKIKDHARKIGKLKRKRVIQFSLNGEYINTFDSIRDASRSVGDSNIRGALKMKKKTAKGFIWQFESDTIDGKINWDKVNKGQQLKLYVFNINKELVKVFDGAGVDEACSYYNIGKRGIEYAIVFKRPTHKKWFFSRLPDIKNNPEYRCDIDRERKVILQLDRKLNIIKEWGHGRLILDSLGCDPTHIRRLCLGDIGTCLGFFWMYKEDYEKRSHIFANASFLCKTGYDRITTKRRGEYNNFIANFDNSKPFEYYSESNQRSEPKPKKVGVKGEIIPFREMKVGDTMFFDGKKEKTVYLSFYAFKKRHNLNWKANVVKKDTGILITRMA